MSSADHFVKDPTQLVELFCQVLEKFGVDANDAGTGERDIQLLEISKAIDRLNSMGTPVPDALRAEKLRLASRSEISEETAAVLEPLIGDLWTLLSRVRARLPKESMRNRAVGNEPSKEPVNRYPENDFSSLVEFVVSPGLARRRAGLNQSAFWNRFGVTQSGGSRYESGREIGGPAQILMMLYASGKITDDDLYAARTALGSAYKQSSE